MSGFASDARRFPQLVHIATDGESYGHHHRFGEMALAYALEEIQTNSLAQLTNYGEFLEKYPNEDPWRSSRTAPGVACTASSAGGAIAAATPADIALESTVAGSAA